ncbi:hypothetical protein vBRpoSV10_5 [Ruegeria phage vB_RpoS-V10]|nr:hypothetical protein DSS3P8_006 [Roseobacter phage DSS3P8]AWY09127.1 hypothetical protein vBRpoSV10_5 [Ruegeria phage vB_RpoS-V10]
MKTIVTNPDLTQIAHDAVMANPVAGYAVLVALVAFFAYKAMDWI